MKKPLFVITEIFLSAVFVAAIFSCIYALIASANNISKAKKMIDNEVII